MDSEEEGHDATSTAPKLFARDAVPFSRTYELKPEEELRFDVGDEDTLTLTLKEGTAEIFGAELAVLRKYSFTGKKMAVFSWYGCKIEVFGRYNSLYSETETPMGSYLNLHAVLDGMRHDRSSRGEKGPVVMVCGPADSGKSSLCTMLTNYCVRLKGVPILAELDVGQGGLVIPGSIGATEVNHAISVENGLELCNPIVFFYGATNAMENFQLLMMQTERLAAAIERKQEASPAAKAAGVILNTPGWIEGAGRNYLKKCAKLFGVDVIAVLESDELRNDMRSSFESKGVRVEKLQKSGGISGGKGSDRSQDVRKRARMNMIRQYFYGMNGKLCPHYIVVDFREVLLYRVGGASQAPRAALPIGAKSSISRILPQQLSLSPQLKHHIVAVSTAQKEEELVSASVFGFVYISSVNVEDYQLTLLAPSPGSLPGKFLIMGELQWIE